MVENPAFDSGNEPVFDSGNEYVRFEVNDGVGTIRIDRPKMNPLSTQVMLAIGRCADEAARREDVAVVVVTGGDKVFAAGADIKEMVTMGQAEMKVAGAQMQEGLNALAALPKPVVAAVNGYALGGGFELAMCADVRIAADDAVLGQPEIKLGIIPGAGGTQRLTRLIGVSRAKDLILTGRNVKADEALQIGMVNRVVPAAEVQQTARDWAAQFVNGPAAAVRAAKECIDWGSGVDLATGLAMERQQFAALFESEDQKIGMNAFVNKEKPEFRGR